MSSGSGGPDPSTSRSTSIKRSSASSTTGTEQEYRLRQTIGDGRRTITVRMPTGWVRAALSGAEAALLGWAIPAMLGVLALLAQGTDPWFQQMNVSTAASIGTDFWSLSLGAPMSVGGLPISLVPLLWTAIEVLMLRGLLWSGKNGQASAQWFAIPTYALTSAVILIASPGRAPVSAVAVGAVAVAAVAVTWAVVSQTEEWPDWVRGSAWIWHGIGYALQWFGAATFVGLSAFLASVFASREAMSEVQSLLGASGSSAVILWVTQGMYSLAFAGWGLAWLAGPGFTLAGDTISSPTSVSTSPLPAFPIAQAVPQTAPGNAVVLVLVGAGIALGALAGWRLRGRQTQESAQVLLVAVLGFSFLIGAWFALSRGALGSELMAHLGPVPLAWPMVALEVGLTATFVGLLVQGGVIRGIKRLADESSGTASPGSRRSEETGHKPSKPSSLKERYSTSGVEKATLEEEEASPKAAPSGSVELPTTSPEEAE